MMTGAQPGERFIASDRRDHNFFPDKTTDHLMRIVIALGAEHWTMRRRLHALERVLEDAGITDAMIEQYRPGEEEEAALRAERDRFIRRVYGSLASRVARQDENDDQHND